jgi:ABC-type multidrug transport system fused ATPase/permease subunit
MNRFGAPIVYLIGWIIFLLLVLAQIDSRFIRLPRSKKAQRATLSLDEKGSDGKAFNADVLAEAQHAISPSTTDPLRILNVSKSYDGARVVDRVSFTIPHHSLFVLLGPNGAGKTTTFDMIRTSFYCQFQYKINHFHLPRWTYQARVRRCQNQRNIRLPRSHQSSCIFRRLSSIHGC